jgi:hypothetical protein
MYVVYPDTAQWKRWSELTSKQRIVALTLGPLPVLAWLSWGLWYGATHGWRIPRSLFVVGILGMIAAESIVVRAFKRHHFRSQERE